MAKRNSNKLQGHGRTGWRSKSRKKHLIVSPMCPRCVPDVSPLNHRTFWQTLGSCARHRHDFCPGGSALTPPKSHGSTYRVIEFEWPRLSDRFQPMHAHALAAQRHRAQSGLPPRTQGSMPVLRSAVKFVDRRPKEKSVRRWVNSEPIRKREPSTPRAPGSEDPRHATASRDPPRV